ncbi:hypothetical protein WG901_21990 [Novosphingobium sp. PS1R-30]|uniref:Uncharacterized protein n=1 Tax=Novosphingobium anseongense TaxID=3133436 RepID=A0ABU8S387_9SPHN
MSVRIEKGVVYLEGRCMAEDAELLLVAIQENPQMRVDIAGMLRAHMAVVQVLLAFRPTIVGEASDKFLSRHVFGPLFLGDKMPKPA